MSTFTRREAIALGAAATLAGTAAGARGVRPPNILFIMADDMGYADVGAYGCTDYKTPHIDSLAARGLKLTDGYSNSSVCSPTRLALMTGRYQYRLRGGLEEPIPNSAAKDAAIGLPPEHPTLPSLLRAAGYHTALVGKWHLGFAPWFGPLKSGYDEAFGPSSGGVDYFTHRNSNGDKDLYDNGQLVERQGYLTDLIGDRCVEVIDRRAKSGQPFFISLHFTAPHWPWEGADDEAVARRIKQIRHYDGGSRKIYGEMMESMDANIGKALAAIRRHGLEANTIVVFTSDNGGERFSDTWPFTGSKTELLEGGIRVPTIVKWPARIKRGGTSEQVMMTMDWLPTLLAAAGAAPDPRFPPDGENLLPVLTGAASPHARTLFWRMKAFGQRAVRSGDWKYLRINGVEHLFNLREDARERAQRKAAEPAIFAELKAKWEAWNATMLTEIASSYSERVDAERFPDHYGLVPGGH